MRHVFVAGLIFGAAVFGVSIPGAAEEAEAPVPALDLANPGIAGSVADHALDDCMLPAADEEAQNNELDRAFGDAAGQETRETPEGQREDAAGEGSQDSSGGTGQNFQALVARRVAAIQDSAQEAAMLSAGAPVRGQGGPAGNPDMAGSFEAFRASAQVGFEAATRGLEGMVPPEALNQMRENFQTMRDRFDQMAEGVRTMMFEGPREGPDGDRPGHPPGFPPAGGPFVPGPGGSMPGPEGGAAPIPMMGFQDMGAMFTGAVMGMDPGRFAEGMRQAMEARAEAFFGPEGMREEGRGHFPGPFPGPEGQFGPMPFAFGPDGANANSFFAGPREGGAFPFMPAGVDPNMPGLPGGVPAGDPNGPAGMPFVPGGDIFQALAAAGGIDPMMGQNREIADAVRDAVRQDIVDRFREGRFEPPPGSPPDLLMQALERNLTLAERDAILAGGPAVMKVINEEINPVFAGQEHVHVTYERQAAGFGDPMEINPIADHVDAVVTIHPADHPPGVELRPPDMHDIEPSGA